MLSALAYLQFHSVKNQLRERLRRLRRPRYFFGAIAGAGYLVLMFGRTFMALGRPQAHPELGSMLALSTEVWMFVAALVLFIGLLLAWVVPHERAALVFSEAEIAFLFPAPVRRRTLIHYKLVRSQTAVLFTVFFLTLLSRWSGGVGGALMRAAGWWMLLSTVNLHLLGSSFARTMLLERGITPWRRRVLVLAVAAVVLVAAVFWAGREVPAPASVDLLSARAVSAYLERLARSAPSVILLAPFRWVARPFVLSNDAWAFAASLPAALLVLLLHYRWVVSSDVAFEEASVAASQRHADRAAAMRAGRWQNVRPARPRRDPFHLSPTGPPAVAILWKNLLSAGQLFSSRVGLALLIWAAGMGGGMALGAGRTAWPQVIGTVAAIIAAWVGGAGPAVRAAGFPAGPRRGGPPQDVSPERLADGAG